MGSEKAATELMTNSHGHTQLPKVQMIDSHSFKLKAKMPKVQMTDSHSFKLNAQIKKD